MTRQLLPHQQGLLDRLRSEPSPSRVLITAPVGAGLSTVLVHVAAEAVAQGDVVVVVVPTRLLLEQWTGRLRGAGVERVDELRKSTEAVVSLDETERQAVVRPGALVANIQVLRHGAGRRAGALLWPSLLIVEQPAIDARAEPGPAAQSNSVHTTVAELASRSQRVIVATNTPSEVPWLHPSVRLEVSLAQALEQRPVNVPLLFARHAVTPSEAELYEEAQRLISEVGGALPVCASTRPALHATIMRLAARLSGEALQEPEDPDAGALEPPAPTTARPGLLEDVWWVLDRIEALEDDSRLRLIVDLVSDAVDAGRPVLVVTDLIEEAEYVVGRLRAHGFSVSALSGSTGLSERRRAAEHFGPGTVVVATRMVLEWLDQPPGAEQIWWSPPRTFADAVQRLTRASEGGRTIALIAEPPLPDDRRLLDLLNRLQLETGFELVAGDG